ncbi:uncharacterized protein G2W53_044271 [Senna tora]|uniref:Uncharacterized protein n=1 Tax=Senna tora TaxID=362788 RepID=A0A834W141_9FABA|nr:uncharacterized protein G2W53_044271 [Senna tora]
MGEILEKREILCGGRKKQVPGVCINCVSQLLGVLRSPNFERRGGNGDTDPKG